MILFDPEWVIPGCLIKVILTWHWYTFFQSTCLSVNPRFDTNWWIIGNKDTSVSTGILRHETPATLFRTVISSSSILLFLANSWKLTLARNWLTSWNGIFGFFVQVFMTVWVCPPRYRGWIFSWRHHFGSRWHRFGSTVVNIDAAHAWTAFGLPKLVSARALKRLRRIIVVPLKAPFYKSFWLDCFLFSLSTWYWTLTS